MNSSFAMLRGTLIRVLTWFVATRRGRVIYLLSVPWLLLLAWLTSVAWFLTDDAFISFRYVRNLLEGHGLVFNPGEYVEGYTNFLWVVVLAIPHWLGVDPIGFSFATGLACFACSLAVRACAAACSAARWAVVAMARVSSIS